MRISRRRRGARQEQEREAVMSTIPIAPTIRITIGIVLGMTLGLALTVVAAIL
jgi:hypothetical protein